MTLVNVDIPGLVLFFLIFCFSMLGVSELNLGLVVNVDILCLPGLINFSTLTNSVTWL